MASYFTPSNLEDIFYSTILLHKDHCVISWNGFFLDKPEIAIAFSGVFS
jgi:hypothetical protein